MAVDLSEHKVPVFPNVNDAPVAPIASKAGNGADLIARLNGLIDALTLLVNSGNIVTNWMVKLPPETDYARIELYYVGGSERNIYKAEVSTSPIGFSGAEPIKTHTLGVDANLNGFINISEVISQYGAGYYFFLFRNTNGTLKNNTVAYVSATTVAGAIGTLDVPIFLYATNNTYNSSNNISIYPIVVRQFINDVEITLLTALPEIG